MADSATSSNEPESGQSSQPRVGVGVLVIRDGRVLLGERRGSHGAGTWAPPGGHLEFGESVEACAAREVYEETGLTVEDVKAAAFTNDVFDRDGKHYVTVFTVAASPSGDPHVLEPAKCARWSWFVWADLPEPLFKPLATLRDQGFVPGLHHLERLRNATELLESIADNRELLIGVPEDDRKRLAIAAGRVSRPDALARRQVVKGAKRERKAAKTQREENVLHATGIRQLRREKAITSPNIFPPAGFQQQEVRDDPEFREVVEPQVCYSCKKEYSAIHHFYDQLCPACASLNYFKRTELADLRGRVALLTGGRVKIGYQAGLKLLRAGASLIVTTRFPRDSAARYAAEPDFPEWSSRLEIFGLDLRHTPSVEAFCRELIGTRTRLDFIVNNACQTVRRPPDFYEHMMEGETASVQSMPSHIRKLLGAYEGLRGYHLLPEADAAAPALARISDVAGLTHSAALSQVALLPEEAGAQKALFPQGQLDEDRQQVDLRDRNSWRLLLAEVPTVELLEVQLVNAIAPFVINARLKPLLMRTAERDKHIVNVSAVEGQFYRKHKTTRHPHTNMAKAALNMMTRTSATEYHADGIHMNSVDTGWVTDEDPADIAARKVAEHRFHPPLDIIDGAARIVDPIIAGFNSGDHVWGRFLKDYRVTDW